MTHFQSILGREPVSEAMAAGVGSTGADGSVDAFDSLSDGSFMPLERAVRFVAELLALERARTRERALLSAMIVPDCAIIVVPTACIRSASCVASSRFWGIWGPIRARLPKSPAVAYVQEESSLTGKIRLSGNGFCCELVVRIVLTEMGLRIISLCVAYGSASALIDRSGVQAP